MDLSDDSTNDSNISMASTSGMLNNSAIKAKIVSGEFKIQNKRGRSKVWDIFGVIENGNGDPIPDLVACRSCFCVNKYCKKSTSNLVRHKCYVLQKSNSDNLIEKIKVDCEIKKKTVCSVTRWAVENCRPFKLVEDSGFKNLAQLLISIGAKYGTNVDVDDLIPHPTTISRNISNLYNKYFNIIKAEIKTITTNGYGLTSDIWTDNFLRTSYISLTIHYVKDGKLNSRLLGLKSLKGESCTANNIKSKIICLLSEFDCDQNDMFIIVTDRGANMISAFRTFNNIFCINHLIHNAIEKSIRENGPISDLHNKCTKLVKYFKKSGFNSSLTTSLKSSVSTRWNTMYYLLDSIEKNWLEISNILQEKNELQRIVNINLSQISALTKMLKLFEQTSKELEGEKFATIHLVIVHIHSLKKQCVVHSDDVDVIANFKIELNHFLDATVLANLTVIHKIALYLFPPANKLIQFTEVEKNIIKDELKSMMQRYINEMPEQVEEASEHIIQEQLYGILSNNVFQDFISPAEVLSPMDRVHNELEEYEKTKVTYRDDFNLLQWWHLRQMEFPLLFKVSCMILATPASSAASERIFSSARQLISEKRSLIGSDPILVNQIMFLHNNVSKTEMFNDF